MVSSGIKLHPRKAAAFLVAVFVLFPVKVVCVETLGALTTNDESDLSFLFGGRGVEGTTSSALTFCRLHGNILVLISCRL
ncbi:hypothetical protein MtrunA17_Chr7g0274201 [Medicago truncatula]|uniref:Uncharacterized protein n=1 Tax=Medicago truncatula TaxID=3880 RepID=A0A396H817_MEDTR|nr:hypothetical protein MtrunA17_Chr7g0274201 [Medicago truncatula]